MSEITVQLLPPNQALASSIASIANDHGGVYDALNYTELGGTLYFHTASMQDLIKIAGNIVSRTGLLRYDDVPIDIEPDDLPLVTFTTSGTEGNGHSASERLVTYYVVNGPTQ